MSKILLDGEGIYRASQLIETIKNKNMNVVDYDSLLNIITAIILWDDIYIFHETLSSHYIEGINHFKQYSDNFCVIDNSSYLPFTLKEMGLGHLIDNPQFMEIFLNLRSNRNNKNGFNGSLLMDERCRALNYLLVANMKGLDYMPSIRRQSILQSYNYTNFFIRKDVIDKIDKELIKYYDSVNEHLPVKRIDYPFPILLDYLFDKYSLHDIIRGAFELKHKKMVVKFRKEMDELDKAWENGNIKNINEYFIEIEHIVNILSKSIKYDKKLNLTISFPPALSFDVNFLHKKPFHSVFLKDLAFYGINNRVPKSLLTNIL